MKHFRILGLSPEPFASLVHAGDAELARAGAIRYTADAGSRYPDRIEVRDVRPGETLLLLNYVHQPSATPYRASHAIFVSEHATRRFDEVDRVPQAMRDRVLSLRAFDTGDMIVDADIVDGGAVETLVHRLFADDRVAYVQAHYAKFGCYAARIERA